MNDSLVFERLRVEGWRQFDSVDVVLHPRLTVLTGANGAGKTSLLRIFSKHFGYERPYLSTPTLRKSGGLDYLSGWFAPFRNLLGFEKTENDVGVLTYSNNTHARLEVPAKNTAAQYQLAIKNKQPVLGMHIDSHQPISSYQIVEQIPTSAISPTRAYDVYEGEMRSRFQGSNSSYSPVYRMKESLIAMAMFGEGNRYVQGDRELLSAYLGFVEVLRRILPDSLGFQDISIRNPEVVLVTRSGEFMLDASSGGILTLFDLAWRLFMFSLRTSKFVVTMDEPENHLHPSMQRTLMRRLLDAFPGAQFIIATHSPFMVSSVKDSNVYVLRYGTVAQPTPAFLPGQRVFSQRLDTVNKAGTASDILREVLGVPATIPEWVEEGLASIIASYRLREFSQENLQAMRAELNAFGYGELYSQALAKVAEGR